jgi:CMP-N,N'-diacetyllegionaminic acid synthase
MAINQDYKILVTVCARKGSKGLAGKNVKVLHGKPLIVHTIDFARNWKRPKEIFFSSDSVEMMEIAQKAGASSPVVRPDELSNDTVGKMPVLHHALTEAEKFFGHKFDLVVDLDPTSPIRTHEELEAGFEAFFKSDCDVCFSVTKARKSPYFNMVERNERGEVRLSKTAPSQVNSRQAAPKVWDMNASIYFYKRDFLASNPKSLWDGKTELFEMSPISAFDIDEERDFIVVEALMKFLNSKK